MLFLRSIATERVTIISDGEERYLQKILRSLRVLLCKSRGPLSAQAQRLYIMKETKDREKVNRYIYKYNEENIVRISLNLNKKKDSDIIEAIGRAGSGNKQAGVKILIRKAIDKEQ